MTLPFCKAQHCAGKATAHSCTVAMTIALQDMGSSTRAPHFYRAASSMIQSTSERRCICGSRICQATQCLLGTTPTPAAGTDWFPRRCLGSPHRRTAAAPNVACPINCTMMIRGASRPSFNNGDGRFSSHDGAVHMSINALTSARRVTACGSSHWMAGCWRAARDTRSKNAGRSGYLIVASAD